MISRRSFVKSGALFVPLIAARKGMCQLPILPSKQVVSSGNGLRNGLVSYWKQDIDSFVKDYQDGNDFTSQGGTVANPPLGLFHNGYLSSSGNVNFRIDAPCPSNLQLGANKSFTLQIWVASNSFASGVGVLGAQYTGIQGTSSWVLFANSGGVKGIGYASVGQYPIGPSSALIADGVTWNHVIFGFDSANKQMFLQVNGGSRTTVSTTSEDLNSVTAGFYLQSDQLAEFFSGGFNASAFWNRVLSTADVTALYNAGAGLPLASFTA